MSESGKASSKPSQKGNVQAMLELRESIKRRKPSFERFESWRYVRIHEEWRKPKGIDNHMRLSVRGWPSLVKIGYRGPRGARGLHPSGYREVLVHNIGELEEVSGDTEAARIAAGVGRRKRVDIAKRAKELNIRVLNGRGLLSPTAEAEEEEEEDTDKKSRRKK
jgi:large subunit ribosomal protein L32e